MVGEPGHPGGQDQGGLRRSRVATVTVVAWSTPAARAPASCNGGPRYG